MSCWAVELPLFDHVHRLDSIKNDARATEYFESQHRSNEPLDSTMILLDILLICFQAMKESGLTWPLITEDEQDKQLARYVAAVKFGEDLNSSRLVPATLNK